MTDSRTGEMDLEFFKESKFEKKRCPKCDSYFWTLDHDRKTCGDPPCDVYSFIGNSPMSRKYTNDEMRNEFISFFKDTHKFLKPYPVVPRWRDDVLLVNASIYDFQPQVTSGLVPPPGNPIVMSQPSIRMVDIDLVGITGRHLTAFEMMCHDAFNHEDKYVYWKEETVRYCHKFLTEPLGIDPNLITYKEKPWSGGGNGGNALEVFVSGLELATLVFMDLKEDKNGEYEIEGKRYSKMKMNIVDTGYGLERLTWLSQGTTTIYEAIYPEIIEQIMNRSDAKPVDSIIMKAFVESATSVDPYNETEALNKTVNALKKVKIETTPEELLRELSAMRSALIAADHAKSLLLMFSDYVIPSNVKVGYLARLLIRRSFKHLADINYKDSLLDIISGHRKLMTEVVENYPEQFIEEILSQELDKYQQVLKKGENIVSRILDKQGKITVDDLIMLYDSYGLYPEFISLISEQKTGKPVEIPENFHSLVIQRHEKITAEEKKLEFPDIETRPLYYDDTKISEFNAVVLYSKNKIIITNQTAFYPEGGGQPTDLGYFQYGKNKIRVKKVEKYGNSIVHFLDGEIPERSRIIGHVDYERRRQLMIHHSSTHLLLGVMRKVLGEHIWQSGVQKDVDESRIDITHYRKITPEQINEIEKKCLEIITQNRKIKVTNMDWNKAIENFGFRLFEGGIPLAKKLRVVEIEGVDAEGCGGTHLNSTGEIGFIKIISAESIQEGIQRVTFVSGPAALRYVQKLYGTVRGIQSALSVELGETYDSFRKVYEENIELKKQRDKMLKKTIKNAVDSAILFEVDGISVRFVEGAFDEEEMKGITRMLHSIGRGLAIVKNDIDTKKHQYLVISSVSISAKGFLSKILNLKPEEIKGTDKFSSCFSDINIGEKLIKEILNSYTLVE